MPRAPPRPIWPATWVRRLPRKSCGAWGNRNGRSLGDETLFETRRKLHKRPEHGLPRCGPATAGRTPCSILIAAVGDLVRPTFSRRLRDARFPEIRDHDASATYACHAPVARLDSRPCAPPRPGFTLPPPLRLAWTLRDDIRANLRQAAWPEKSFRHLVVVLRPPGFCRRRRQRGARPKGAAARGRAPRRNAGQPADHPAHGLRLALRASETTRFDRGSAAGRAAFAAWFFFQRRAGDGALALAVPGAAVLAPRGGQRRPWLRSACPCRAWPGLSGRPGTTCAGPMLRTRPKRAGPACLVRAAWRGGDGPHRRSGLAAAPALDAPVPELGGLSRRAVLAWMTDEDAGKALIRPGPTIIRPSCPGPARRDKPLPARHANGKPLPLPGARRPAAPGLWRQHHRLRPGGAWHRRGLAHVRPVPGRGRRALRRGQRAGRAAVRQATAGSTPV